MGLKRHFISSENWIQKKRWFFLMFSFVLVSNALNVLNTIWCSHKCLRYFVWCKFMIVKKILGTCRHSIDCSNFSSYNLCPVCVLSALGPGFSFFNFVTSKIWRKFSENLAKLVGFTREKRKFPKFSQMFSDKW
jgi:hypothetical protein